MESINLKEKGIIDFKNKLDKVFNEMDYYIKSNNITPIYKGMFQNKANNIHFLYDNFLESDPDLTIFTEFLSSQNFNENYKLKENKPTGYGF